MTPKPARASAGARAEGARIASLAFGTGAPRSEIVVSSWPKLSAARRSVPAQPRNIESISARRAPTSPTPRMNGSGCTGLGGGAGGIEQPEPDQHDQQRSREEDSGDQQGRAGK